MLEELAFRYVNTSEIGLQAIAVGVIIVGFVVAVVATRSESELPRAPHFAFFGLLVLLLGAVQFVWLASMQAMTGGFLWLLISIDIISKFAFGYFIGIISMARSRDAFGHAGYAALVLIPIANLVLFFKSSKLEASTNRIPTIPLLTGGLGVFTGSVLLVATAILSLALETQGERMAEQIQNDPSLQAASVNALIRSEGLEGAIAQLAAEVTVPMQVDEITTLTEVEADATTLRFIYAIDAKGGNLVDGRGEYLTHNTCTDEGMQPVLSSGGALEHVFYLTDGPEIERVRVTQERCSI